MSQAAALKRWPAAAAVGAAACLVLAPRARRRGGRFFATYLALLALLIHQVEEWLWPGGFQEWFNRFAIGSPRADFPLTDRQGFAVNVVGGWGSAAAALAFGGRLEALPALVGASHLANAGLHIGLAVRQRRANPGLRSAAALLLPTGSYLLARAGGRGGQRALGAIAGAATIPGLLLRFRRGAGSRRD